MSSWASCWIVLSIFVWVVNKITSIRSEFCIVFESNLPGNDCCYFQSFHQLVVSCAFVNLLIPAYPFTTLTAALQVNAGLEKWCNLFANLKQRGWTLLRGLLRQWSWKLFHFYHLHPHFKAAKQRPNRKALDGRGLQTLLWIVESARTLKSKHTNNVGYNISVLHLQLCWPYLKLRNVPSMYIRSFVLQVSVRS